MVGTIDIENGKLIFRLTGADRVLALKSELKVPLTHVTSVSTEKADWNYFTMLKLAGARLPHVIASGSFVSKDGLLFYDMRNPDKCVTVELSGEKYKKVVFEVEDKKATANEIERSLHELANKG